MDKKNLKILTIDDHKDNLISLKALIREAFPDAIILLAENGPTGIDLARTEDPDVILLDVVMPAMDGFEVCQRLKADTTTRDIPVVFLTALKGDRSSRIKALEVGAEAFLAKPVDETELTAIIRAMGKIKAGNNQNRLEKGHLARQVEEQTRELNIAHATTLKLLENLYSENETRRQNEINLQKAMQFLEEAQRIAHMGSWEWNLTTNQCTWSSEVYRITGRSQELGTPQIDTWLDNIFPDDRTLLQKAVQTAMTKGSYQMDYRILRYDDAQIRWVHDEGNVSYANGLPAFLHGVTQDITERKLAEEILLVSEEKYRILYESASVGIGYFSPDGRIVSFNSIAAKNLGGAPRDFAGKMLSEVFPGPAADNNMEMIRRAAVSGKSEEYEEKMDLPGGPKWFVNTISRILNPANQVIGVQIISTDVTKLKLTEIALRESEAALNRAQHVSHVGSWAWHSPNNRLEWSDEMYQVFGIQKENFNGSLADVITNAIHPDDRAAVEKSNNSVIQEQKTIPLEYRVIRPDGTVRVVWAEAGELILDPAGNTEILTGIVQDITERKQIEEQRQVERELLQICHFATSPSQLIHDLTAYFRRITECEAVGVRLHQGEDFPYYETSGFPEKFVVAERTLCARDRKGELLRTSSGDPILECMCGNVLCERFDPSKPFFTKRGSFWSSNTTELLATTTEKDRQSRTRNRCNGEGYESVALVPIRLQGKTLGLFQFNDRRKGHFNLERITFFESLVDYVSLALANLEAAQALRESEERYRLLFESMESGFALHEILCDAQGTPYDYRFLEINPAFEKLTGLKSEEVIGHSVLDALPGTEKEWIERYGKVALRGESIQFENYSRELGKYFHVSAYSPMPGQFAVIFQDITERKRADEELMKSKLMLTNILNSVPQTIFWKDCEGKFLGCNENFARTVGLADPRKVVGMTDYDFSGSRSAIAAYRGDDQDVITQKQPKRHITEQVRTADGTTIWTDTTKVPLVDPAGNVYGVLGVFEDVTTRKVTEQKISDQLDELRRWYSAMLGREKRIIELKMEVNELLLQAGQPQRYASVLKDSSA